MPVNVVAKLLLLFLVWSEGRAWQVGAGPEDAFQLNVNRGQLRKLSLAKAAPCGKFLPRRG
jgi:hypothetical protein